MCIGENLTSQLHLFWVLGRNILFFTEIGGKMKEFNRGVFLMIQIALNRFPIAKPSGSFTSLLIKFPVEIVMLFLTFGVPDQFLKHGNTVGPVRYGCPCEFANGW